MIHKIVSGGQTGVDRAALDVALNLGLDIGGWAPKGFIAEDGTIDGRYKLRETTDSNPEQRTEWNVRDSDATLIIAPSPLQGGTALTLEFAKRYNKPWLWIDPQLETTDEAALKISSWLLGLKARVLNIAGPRLSECPQIYSISYNILRSAPWSAK